jgi:IS6 family transposase
VAVIEAGLSSEVVTDAAAIYPAVLEELVPPAWHHVERHANK